MIRIDELFEIINGVPSSQVEVFNEYRKNRVKYARPSNNYRSTLAGYIEESTVDESKVFPSETLFVSTDGEGSHTYSYVSTCKFVPNSNVAVLIPKKKLTLQEKIFYSICITSNRYRFNYGRKPKGERLKSILIPGNDKIPDLVNNVDAYQFDHANQPFNTTSSPNLDISNWDFFKLEDLFEIKKGKRLTKANMEKGKVPFIGSIDSNNGYREYIGQEPIHAGNTITINYNGSVAEAFYQPKPFWASDDVNVLYPKFEMNQYIALFMVTLIKMEKYRFNYGRKWHMERMNISEIKLPVVESGTPDYEFMERYIKSLPFSKRI